MKLCVVGLGYVGLPLAVALAKHYQVIGFDVKKERIDELKKGIDSTKEVEEKELKESKIEFTTETAMIKEADFVIICVPTPTTADKKPDLMPICKAGETVGRNLKKGAVVVLESTVYPGVTEEVLTPALEEASGMKCGQDFKVGYSPERMNPGDKEHSLQKLVKVVSGMDAETLEKVAEVYGKVTTVHKAPNIKTAEAAKVIENIQRDLNIALVNELALIFDKMDLEIKDVLLAAGTKWNFHKYSPGLVGGHCIPVDPYYLTEKSLQLGYNPQVILAGRFINEYMPVHIVNWVEKGLKETGKKVQRAKIGVLGLTFKENVPDSRNSRVKDLIRELQSRGMTVVAHDPLLGETEKAFNTENKPLENLTELDAVILAVNHKNFANLTLEKIKELCLGKAVLIDIPGRYSKKESKGIWYKGLGIGYKPVTP